MFCDAKGIPYVTYYAERIDELPEPSGT
jgi:hypothetical protein